MGENKFARLLGRQFRPDLIDRQTIEPYDDLIREELGIKLTPDQQRQVDERTARAIGLARIISDSMF